MFLEEKNSSILAMAFFIACVFEITYLSFFVFNSDVKKKIYSILGNQIGTLFGTTVGASLSE